VVVLLGLVGTFHSVGGQEPAGSAEEPSQQNDLVIQTEALRETIQQQRDEIAKLREERDQAVGEDRVLLERRSMRVALEALANVDVSTPRIWSACSRRRPVSAWTA
jgi:hypothetical protein